MIRFKYTDGFPDLIVGERFDDAFGEECWSYEEKSNSDLTCNYWLPLFDAHFPDRSRYKPRVLSVGCGTGIDIDILTDEGFDIVGNEIGNRSGAWKKRKHPERFLLANGMHLPFESNYFDIVYCGCLFPHVGVVGDSFKVREDYCSIRTRLAGEMARVLKKDGFIVVSSPNGNAPLDLFHGRGEGSYRPRINPPWNPCIPKIEDYRKMFFAGGCRAIEALPNRKYWGFVRSRKSIKGFILGIPVRFLFWLTSRVPVFRGTFLDPWIVVKLTKS
ncbi:MAG: class I SAM-dependent methyltransferase [Acidobacteria bacterium]|nr:class I SAM-dependent methyltransferase [Acidobacteriota bacterium]